MLGPGHEAGIAALFPYGERAPTGHRVGDIRIVHDRVLVDLALGEETSTLVLRAPGAVERPAARTRHFALVGDGLPPALLAWAAQRVRDREQASPWISIREAPPRAAGADSELRSRASTPPLEHLYVHWVLPSLWLLFLALGAAAAARELRRIGGRRLLTVALLFAGALTLRVLLPPFGPGDIKNTLLSAYQGWPLAGLDAVGRYGAGVEGLLVWLFQLLPTSDDTVVGASLVLGSLSVPLLGALARRLGFSPRAAFFAALLLALSPLHIRFSPTTGRYTFLIFLLLAGWSLLLVWLERGSRLALAGAVLGLTLAVQCRPEAVATPVLSAGLLLSQFGRRRERLRAGRRAIGLAAAVHGALLVVPLLPLLAQVAAGGADASIYLVGRRPLFSPVHNPFLSGDYTPLVWTVTAALGLLAGPRGATAWAALGGLLLSYLLCTAIVADGQLLNARYHLPALPLYFLLAGSGLDGLLRLVGVDRLAAPSSLAASAAAAALLLAPVLGVLPAIVRTTTPNDEYAFLKGALGAVPDECDVVYPEADSDHGLRRQPGLSISLGRRHRWISAERYQAAPDGNCAVFFASAACAADGARSLQGRPLAELCAQWRRKTGAAPLAETRVPNVPLRSERYREDPVPIGIYWFRKP